MLKVDQTERLPGRGRFKSRLALLGLGVYWPGIFILSHIPKEHVPKNWEFSGVRLHLGAYFVLTLLVFLSAGVFRTVSLRCAKTWLLAGLIGVYAAIDELLQTQISGREGSLIDWGIDIIAVLACVGFLRLLNKTGKQGT